MTRQSCLTMLLALCILTAPGRACAPFFPEDHFGYLAEEVALLIWSAESQQQHFIRRAGFRTKADRVGFMVPTPSKPEFAEIDNDIFTRLDHLTRPKVVHKNKYIPRLGSLFTLFQVGNAPVGGLAATPSVQLLDHLTIADQEVAVLKATEVEALEKWLTDNGFPFDPAARDWLRPYIDEGYIISAFRYLAPEEGAEGVGSRAVRMSFASERPYFPYREPQRAQDKTPGRRSLRVYLLSQKKMQGFLGENPWGAEMRFSAPVELPDQLKALGSGNWLGVFDDASIHRPAAHDLRFEVGPDQSEVKPPPRVVRRYRRIPIPIELLLLAAAFVLYKLKKARSS